MKIKEVWARLNKPRKWYREEYRRASAIFGLMPLALFILSPLILLSLRWIFPGMTINTGVAMFLIGLSCGIPIGCVLIFNYVDKHERKLAEKKIKATKPKGGEKG